MPFISASVISPYNSIRGGAEGGLVPLLLDLYPNDNIIAQSVRKLNSSDSTFAMEVRESVGSGNLDVGYVGEDLDTVSLLAHTGGNNGLVPIFYDKVGSANQLQQTLASFQPSIVTSGVVNELSGKPTLRFGSNRYMKTASDVALGSPTELWFYAVVNLTDVNTYSFIYSSTASSNFNGGFSIYVGGGDLFVGIQGATFIQSKTPITTGNKVIIVRLRGGQTDVNAIEIYINSVQATLTVTNAGTSNATFEDFNHYLGCRQDLLFRFRGDISEVLLKKSDQSFNRAGIEANINNYYKIYWDGSQTGLLDDYPNASAAYSLRALSSAYTGPAIEVRKTVGGVTSVKDIGFLYDGSLDTDSLLTFADGGDVFVAKWYDQSGAGNDAIEITESGQASIVLSGVLNTTNGNVAAFGKINTSYVTGYSVFTAADGTYSGFVVSKLADSFDGVMQLNNLSSGGGGEIFRYFNTSSTTFRIQSWDSSGVAPVLVTEPISANSNAISSFIRRLDSLTTSSNSLTNSLLGLGAPRKNIYERLLIMGFTGVSNGLESYFSEAILYPSDQTSKRTGIESNINSHYNIYWDGSQTGLLDDYPSAVAAYSLRALSSAYTGPAIEVRKTVAGETFIQDIGFLYDGSLDTESLLSFAGSDDVFVAKWYDQSGGNNATQGSASNQPKIVSLGSVILANGKDAIEFNGQLNLKVSSEINFQSFFAVSKVDTATNVNIIIGSLTGLGDSRTTFIAQRGNNSGYNGLSVLDTSGIETLNNSETLNQQLNTYIFDGQNAFLSSDNGTLTNVGDAQLLLRTIGNVNNFASNSLNGKMQELIIYPSDQSANRVAIETNINAHYTIY